MSLVNTNLPLKYQPYTGTTEPSLGAYRAAQTLAGVLVQSCYRVSLGPILGATENGWLLEVGQ